MSQYINAGCWIWMWKFYFHSWWCYDICSFFGWWDGETLEVQDHVWCFHTVYLQNITINCSVVSPELKYWKQCLWESWEWLWEWKDSVYCFTGNCWIVFWCILPVCEHNMVPYLWNENKSKFQINQPTRCDNFSSLLLDVYMRLNMFRAPLRPSSGAQQLQMQPPVLPLERGGSSAVGHGQAGWPNHDQQLCYPHAPTVKPEAASAVVELLMMGVKEPKTCWAAHKHQVINLRNCRI